jgi:hypothetical protein
MDAIKIMTVKGWHKGASVGPGGSVCAARALNMAAKARSGDWADLEAAGKVLAGLIPDTKTKDMIARWNDANSTDFKTVVEVFSAAWSKMQGMTHEV